MVEARGLADRDGACRRVDVEVASVVASGDGAVRGGVVHHGRGPHAHVRRYVLGDRGRGISVEAEYRVRDVDVVRLARGDVAGAHGPHVELEGVVPICIEGVLVVEGCRGHGGVEGCHAIDGGGEQSAVIPLAV